MIPPSILKTSKEYIEETIFNSLWRVCLKKSSLKDEAAHLTRLMLETRELLIKRNVMKPNIDYLQFLINGQELTPTEKEQTIKEWKELLAYVEGLEKSNNIY